MDQNQTVDSDLQKAIDDITKTTSVDPVFSDPVAAPSSIPEGDNGALAEAVGPFPEPKMDLPAPETEPLAPIMPDFQMPDLPEPVEPPVIPEPMGLPVVSEPVEPAAPRQVAEPYQPESPASHAAPNMQQIKEAALRDLAPVLSRININPSQKFQIYRNIFENLKDYTVLESAYLAAKEIADEKERGEALLYLIEAIDRI